MAQLSELPRRLALTQHLLDGISRHDVNPKKDECENEPERRQREEESFEEERAIGIESAMNSPETVSNSWRVAAQPLRFPVSCSRFQQSECAGSLLAQRAFRPFQRLRIGNYHTQSFLLPWG